MNTKHVPSLELCQELDRLCKENNITLPETEYCWMPVTMPPIDGVEYILAKVGKDCPTNYRYGFPAPLVSEQGEWLPLRIDLKVKANGDRSKVAYFLELQAGGFVLYYAHHLNHRKKFGYGEASDLKEANARMKCLLYLLENDIIDGNAFN